MPDADLADIYGVSRKAVNLAVRRSLDRFPVDFAFQLNTSETAHLRRSQLATSNPQDIPRIHPWVFTDHGALMAAFVLNSKQAIRMSIHIVRASVRLGEMVASDEWLARILDDLERRVLHHDEEITSILRVIRKLALSRKPNARRRIRLIPGARRLAPTTPSLRDTPPPAGGESPIQSMLTGGKGEGS
jgi:hypothetical protein